MSKCLNLIEKANKARLNNDTLKEIIKELQSVVDANKAASGLKTVEEKLFDKGELMVNEAEIAKKIERRNRFKNILIERKIIELAEEADKMLQDPSLALESVLVGINAPIPGAQRSIDSMINAMGGEYLGGLIADLRGAKLLTKFNTMKGDFESEVARELYNLNSKVPLPNIRSSRDAKDIAKIMFKYQRTALHRENKAGAFIRLKEGRIVTTVHNPALMTKAGLDEWTTFMMKDKMVNWDKTANGQFKDDTNIVAREEFLRRSYQAITTGVRITQERTEIGKAFTGPQNIAKSRSASAIFTFRDADAWMEYNRTFGRGSLRESFVQDLQGSIRSTALMERLGTNPQAMFKRVQDRLLEKYRDDPDPTKIKRLRRQGVIDNFDSMLKEVTGEINFGSHTTLARTMHGVRAFQTMAKLGGAAISAFSDIAFMASNRMYQGQSLIGAWNDSFMALFKGMKQGEMREFADRLGIGIEAQLGDFMSRFNASDDIPGKSSKYLNTFFKLNLLQPWTEANKRGITLIIANDLARHAKKGYSGLPDNMKTLLTLYDIDANKWEAIRKGVKRGPDGREYIVPGEIPDESVRGNVFNLLTNEAEFSVPSPGARERAILRQGYQPGTLAGESIRFVAQFKSFGVLGITKNLGRQVHGSGAKTLREALARGVGGNLGLVNTIAGTTLMGYIVLQAKQIAAGKEPRKVDSVNDAYKIILASAMQGGGAGIYGDFLFGQANRYGGGTLETLAGPGLGTLAETIDLLQRTGNRLASGDDNISGDWIRLLKSNVPGANLFYTKQALDYMVWHQMQEYVNPGYLARMEQRIKRENDQEFYIPPSSIVPFGSSFR